MSSVAKRQANRRNALRSTGPKSAQGKKRSSLNAAKHGLSAPVPLDFQSAQGAELVGLIQGEGVSQEAAQELAQKIFDFERNQAFQRKLHLEVGAADLPPEQFAQEVQSRFGYELELLNDFVYDQQFFNGRVTKREMNWVTSTKGKYAVLAARMHHEDVRRARRELQRSLRYLKRSSNQLIKAVKALNT